MILFSNNIITDVRASVGGMNRVDRLDLFKYTLASYSCIPAITEVIVCCELAGSYVSRAQDLREYVNLLFPARKVTFRSESPSTQTLWRQVLTETGLVESAQPILYLGNDDHVFIDYDLEWLNEGLALMAAQPESQINTLHISSWPEAISTMYGLNQYVTTPSGHFWEAELFYVDSIQIVNAEYFRHIFFDLDLGDAYVRRTDAILTNWYPYLGDYAFPLVSGSEVHPVVRTFVPLREMVRHFDSYWHVEMSLKDCPLLSVPPGFFESKIRIDYGAEKPLDGGHWMNPLDPECPDQRTLEDIPLFWKGRIAAIHNYTPAGITQQALLDGRNSAHRRIMTAPHNRGYQRPYGRDVRRPAKVPQGYRQLDNGPLPLEESYITAGYRTC